VCDSSHHQKNQDLSRAHLFFSTHHGPRMSGRMRISRRDVALVPVEVVQGGSGSPTETVEATCASRARRVSASQKLR
jgi:hypothetical protein